MCVSPAIPFLALSSDHYESTMSLGEVSTLIISPLSFSRSLVLSFSFPRATPPTDRNEVNPHIFGIHAPPIASAIKL